MGTKGRNLGQLLKIFVFLLGGNGSCGSGRREGEGGSDSGRSEEERGVVVGIGAEEKVDDMAAFDGVGRAAVGRWWWEQWGRGGVLYTECELYGNCSEKEEQEIGRLFDHYKATKGFLAFGLKLNLQIELWL